MQQFPASDTPQVYHISLLYKRVVSDGTFPICGCPFREPRVFTIAHIYTAFYIYIYIYYLFMFISGQYIIYIYICLGIHVYINICMYIVHICNYRLFFWDILMFVFGNRRRIAISQAEMLTWWLMDHLKQDHTQPVRGLFIVWFCWQNRDGFDLALKSLNDGFMSQESIFLFSQSIQGIAWKIGSFNGWAYGYMGRKRRAEDYNTWVSSFQP